MSWPTAARLGWGLVASLWLGAIAGACSPDDDATPPPADASDGGGGGGGGADASAVDGSGGNGGCILIGCAVGYEKQEACSQCEPIPNWCPEGYEQCAEIDWTCEPLGVQHHPQQNECCICASG